MSSAPISTAASSIDAAPDVGVVTGRADERAAGLVELEAGELAGHVEARDGYTVGGPLDEERLQALACARGHEHPVGGESVGDHRLHAVDLVASAATVGAHVHALDRVAVAGFVERDRAPLRAGRERLELVGETERAGGERREDRRREERAREQRAAHLLLHDDRVDDPEAEPAGRLGHEQTRPAEVDDLAPHLGGDPGVVVLGHAPHVRDRRLGREERAHGFAQRELLREKEVHATTSMSLTLMSGCVDFAWSPEDVAFKEELEAFLDKEMPPFIEQWSDNEDADASRGVMGVMDKRKAWQNKLNEGRWAAILWPEEWGGRAATTAQQVIYTQVMAKYRSTGIFNANGIVQIGPSIISWGTEDQKARWLPGILDASEHWCQGFSEPQAGSDLANLRTTAILSDDGSHYVVNGQKTWISSAQIAKWGLFLMRTDPTAIERGRKHEGITTFIVDMELPGIDIRPIREITGDSLFCEVFFDDVKIPVGDRLGDEGNGWLVSMGALGQERVGSAGRRSRWRRTCARCCRPRRPRTPTRCATPRSASVSPSCTCRSTSRGC